MRGEAPKQAQAVTPMFGAAVLSERPTFAWRAADGVKSYRVELLSGAGHVRWSAATTTPQLPYPKDQPPLALGRIHFWKVTARLAGDETAAIVDSKFFTATRTEIDELTALPQLDSGSDAADLLMAATVYEAHGVYDEALRMYQLLAKQSPKEANFHATLANYYERAGRPQEANDSRERAIQLGWRRLEETPQE
jgi:tetratricopeptide (TPR) repeat protein